MLNRRHIIFSLFGLCAGCSSVTESGLTKQEIRDIKRAVAQQTATPIAHFGVPRPLKPNDLLFATTEDGQDFALRRSPDGWKAVKTKANKAGSFAGPLPEE